MHRPPACPAWPVLLLAAFTAAAAAAQTGPATLENLLPPAAAEPPARKRPGAAQMPRPPAGPNEQPETPAERLEVPAATAVDEALALIEQAYEDPLAAAKADPEAAIRTLRDAADRTADAARQYALLLRAERLAVDARLTSRALEAVSLRARLFEIDGLKARHDLLATIVRGGAAPLDALFFEHVTGTIRASLDAERFDLADAAADLAVTVAKTMEKEEKVRATESRRKREQPPPAVAAGLVAEAGQLQKIVRERRRQTAEFLAARERLAAAPEDAAAAEAVGRYLCFVKHDWSAGLPALAKGTDEALRHLAARELALEARKVVAAADHLDLANAWWKLALDDDQTSTLRAKALQAHAGDIYRRILPQLTDPVDLALARKRAKSAAGDSSPDAPAPAGGGGLPGLGDLFPPNR